MKRVPLVRSPRIMSGLFSENQAAWLTTAQSLFIFEQIVIFPLYYLPVFRSLLNGDGKSVKFPCSISWMTRKGLPRLVTLVIWNAGWLCMMRAFFLDGDLFSTPRPVDWLRAVFMLQMYLTGFATVVTGEGFEPFVSMVCVYNGAHIIHAGADTYERSRRGAWLLGRIALLLCDGVHRRPLHCKRVCAWCPPDQPVWRGFHCQ